MQTIRQIGLFFVATAALLTFIRWAVVHTNPYHDITPESRDPRTAFMTSFDKRESSNKISSTSRTSTSNRPYHVHGHAVLAANSKMLDQHVEFALHEQNGDGAEMGDDDEGGARTRASGRSGLERSRALYRRSSRGSVVSKSGRHPAPRPTAPSRAHPPRAASPRPTEVPIETEPPTEALLDDETAANRYNQESEDDNPDADGPPAITQASESPALEDSYLELDTLEQEQLESLETGEDQAVSQIQGNETGSSSGGDWDLEDPHSEDLHPKEPPETEIEPSRESLLEQDEEEERALVQAAIGINLDEYGGQEQGARASAPPPGPARGWNLTSLFSTVHSKVKGAATYAIGIVRHPNGTDEEEFVGSWERGDMEGGERGTMSPADRMNLLLEDNPQVQALLKKRPKHLGPFLNLTWPPNVEKPPVHVHLNYRQFVEDGQIPKKERPPRVFLQYLAESKDGRVLSKYVFHRKILPHLPQEDTQLSYNKCAIVSNSGELLLSKYGEEIDEHDAVFRINYPPLSGYEEYVGSKTTFDVTNHHNAQTLLQPSSSMFIPPSIKTFRATSANQSTLVLFETANSEGWRLYFLPEILSRFPGQVGVLSPDFMVAAEETWRNISSEVAAKGEACSAMKRRIERAAAQLEDSQSGARKQMRGIGAHSMSLRSGLVEACKPTSGWFVLVLAVQICDEVHMYGFSNWKKQRKGMKQAAYHYFDKVQGVTNVHSFDMSLRIYQRISQEYSVFLH